MLTKEQWSGAMALFDDALGWPVEERPERLAAATDDVAVRDEVASLLAASANTRGFFSRPLGADALTGIADLPSNARVGSWRVIRILGRGGMGAVYEAARAEGGFDQRAALKIIGIAADGYSARFEDERAIVARLDYPGIARLYDGGIDARGFPFMAMELVDGAPITRHAEAAALPVAARLALFGQVCDAAAYAQRNLVLHLDIKPANVLVTQDDAVKLLDFGASRALGAGLSEATAATMLTPAYAAPEQRDGRAVTTATDVYALGVMLHELLTGALPAAGVASLALDGDLRAIIGRAIQSDPAARYANAGALGADVRRHLAGEPVSVRAGSRLYVAGRALRRYRWAAATAVLLMASLAGGAIATSIQARHAINERDHLAAEVDRTNAAIDYLALMVGTAHSASGDKAVTVSDVLRRSETNLDHSFAGDPRKYGRVVEFLGNVYNNLTDDAHAASFEARYLASSAAAIDPVTAGRIRILLAQAQMRQGNLDQAAAVLAPAQAFWSRDPDRHAGELARSRIIEGQIKKLGGDLPGAIATLRMGLAEAARPSSGIDAEDVSNLQNSLALALMADGSYPEAKELITKVRAFRAKGGRINDNLLTAIQNEGAIDLAMGNLPAAEALLRQAIAQRSALFGPSGAMAAAQQNLARVLLLEDRGGDVEALAKASVPIAVRYTTAKSPLTVAGIVLAAAGAAQAGAADAVALAALARAATAAKPDPLHALSLAVDARNAANAGREADRRDAAAEGRVMLANAGKSGLMSRALFARLVQPTAVNSR